MLNFSKYHGLGNDFIIFSEKDVKGLDYSLLAKNVCNRNFGIGADGMMVVSKTEIADIKMEFYNADGSIAPMCGNGIRCFAHYVVDNKIIDKKEFSVDTLAGVLKAVTQNGDEFLVEIDMGLPNFSPEKIPVNIEKSEYIGEKIKALDKEFDISGVFMGTTHTVIITDEINNDDVIKYGKDIENNLIFPVKTNVNFCKIKDENEIDVTTWERGAGLTLACGTGCCASVVIANRFGKISKDVKVNVPGGSMYIRLTDKAVFMKGPSQKIAEGQYFFQK